MTLLVIRRAKGGIVALSDRMESVGQSGANEVTKYYLSVSGGFYIALAGDGETARHILSELRHRQPSGADVFREIDRIAAELFIKNRAGHVEGHLIVADGCEFRVYAISVVSGIMAYSQHSGTIPAEGDLGAVALYDGLVRDLPLSDMPCDTAAKCLHTVAGRVAEAVDSVGDRAKYGIDMVVFEESGTMTQLRRRTDKMGTIRVSFEPSDTGPLLGPSGGD